MKLKFSILAGIMTTAIGVIAPNYAHAYGQYDPTVSTTNVADGSSVLIYGTVFANGGSAMPWTDQIFARAGECLRVFVPTTTFDSELVVIAPSGTVWRNDDGGGSLRPLVKINGAPNTGWYTVRVAHFAGSGIVNDFGLYYGRYNYNNANCSGATVPMAVAGMAEAPKDPNTLVTPSPLNSVSGTGAK